MTEDSTVRVSSSDETSLANDASQTRQRKKRKWDQPAESLMAVGMAVPGVLPLSNGVPLGGVAFQGLAPVISGALLTNPLAASAQLQQHTTAATVSAQKLNQQKIQDELIIAREIVINDAESSVRYKLTKRQTQEEIQRCTGAIVITRGKYRPPNAPLDGEKPLYLHISAGAHIKETAERILAVDRAAAMIEEMLKQGQNSQSISTASPSTLVNGLKMLSTCVFLGFDADPSLNIVARIRGPNDQYINHIMNETGATVVLRGRGSGNNECLNGEDGQQPLHLFLSSNNAKSLEDARFLAENLLDTISTECGALRVSSCKVYSAVPPPQQVYTAVPPPQQVYSAVPPPQQVYSGPSLLKQIPTAISPPQVYSAVPPPQQLLTGVQSSGIEPEAGTGLTTSSMSAAVALTPVPPASLVGAAGVTASLTLGTTLQSTGHLSSGPQANMIGYTPPLVSGGTSYIGYGGIYPQATPLQQVALALRHSPPVASTVAPTTSAPSRESKSTSSSDLEKEKRPPQKRKFQELPVGSKGTTKFNQGLQPLNPNEQSDGLVVRNISTMPAPKKLVQPSPNGMPQPLPRTMPPPPPPKFCDTSEVEVQDKYKNLLKTKSDAVPDTLVKLMEYGEEDDDLDDSSEESLPHATQAVGVQKPFWAL
ncbi:protein RIK isoform X1 [Cajanus cajan]|uniref:protein RIK isoform X1 n=1 Tax=Cajanus cajan TaxID=3821 RepID=UPI00098DC3F1|nr:protein RIK isoform X1 [Cajanus cajan]